MFTSCDALIHGLLSFFPFSKSNSQMLHCFWRGKDWPYRAPYRECFSLGAQLSSNFQLALDRTLQLTSSFLSKKVKPMKLLLASWECDEIAQAGLNWQRWSYYSQFVRKEKNGSESWGELPDHTATSSTAKPRFDAIFSSFQTFEAVCVFIFNTTHFLTSQSYDPQVVLSLKWR